MTNKKKAIWLVAIIGIVAGFLMGLWAGSYFLPRLKTAQLSDLSDEQQDQYVSLVALGYGATGDFDDAKTQLNLLNAPNPQLLVSGVLERFAKQGRPPAQLAALAQLALKLGAPHTTLARYLATPTPIPPTPTLAATATQPPAQSAAPQATATAVIAAEAQPATATATAAATATATVAPTATPEPKPMASASSAMNVRSGPGTAYPVVASLNDGDNAVILFKNPAGDWWQVRLPDESMGWVYGPIIKTTGDTSGISVAANIPAPPATPTPAATPVPTAPPKPSVDYVVTSVRLWSPQENGGYFDGPSLHCGEKRQLRAIVLDAGGQPLNGVTVLGIYSKDEQVSKGQGVAEWVLGDGDGLRVIRDANGSAVVSETAEGLVTDPTRISDEAFMAAGYCTDAASCQVLRTGNACHGHYSWDVTFQRTH